MLYYNVNSLWIFIQTLSLQNLTENVVKIAEFIDASCTKEFAEQIAERCSFDNIKKHRSDPTAQMALGGKSTLYRKGR